MSESEHYVSEHRILDPSQTGDSAEIDRLIADGTTSVLDTTTEQLHSFDALLPQTDAGSRADGTRWIHYPWRHALVRLLGPTSFRRLRLDRNRNKITLPEQDSMDRLRVGVVGLSVGHAVAHTVALEGLCGELRLADFDELDLSNLNRVPATVFDLGVNKAVVAARRIAEIDPYVGVRTYTDGITPGTIDDFLNDLDVVIEECDSMDAKVMVREHARRRGIPVVMETSDGGVLDVERFDLEPERQLFHGLLGDIDQESLASMTAAQKASMAARILDPAKVTARMLASVPEIGSTLSSWPQLGSDVALGGASVAAVIRSFGLGTPPPSGRVRIDLDALVADGRDPSTGV
ncbi:Rv1355c family protein [Actinomycetes bacterium M1A6_2h]